MHPSCRRRGTVREVHKRITSTDVPDVQLVAQHTLCDSKTSHHLVLIGSDNNNIHYPVQDVTNTSGLHPLRSAGRAARGEVLEANLLLCQVLQTANLCDSRTEMRHHPSSSRRKRRET